MTIKLFPEGFDPVIATGPPSDDYIAMGICGWTEEDTLKHQELEKQFQTVEVERPPMDQWYITVEE